MDSFLFFLKNDNFIYVLYIINRYYYSVFIAYFLYFILLNFNININKIYIYFKFIIIVF